MKVRGGVLEAQLESEGWKWISCWHYFHACGDDVDMVWPTLDPVPHLVCDAALLLLSVWPRALHWTTLALVDCTFWYDTFWGGHKPWTICSF